MNTVPNVEVSGPAQLTGWVSIKLDVINRYRMRFMNRIFLISVLLAVLATSLAHADELKPPQTLEYGGKSYQLTSAAKMAETSGDRLFYRYTSGNETKDQWTSMVIIQFSPHVHLKDEAWAKNVKSYFDASNPRPYYRIDSIGGNPFARYLNPPTNERPSESSVMRFFSDGCGGQVVFQYLEKVDASNVPKAWSHNEQALSDMVNYPWQPDCIVH
jgi:hypothetical protein